MRQCPPFPENIMRISFSLLLLVGLLLGPTDANAAKDYGKELNKATEIAHAIVTRYGMDTCARQGST